MDLEPPRLMVWSDASHDTTWVWSLHPGASGTRLVTRVRIRYRWPRPGILFSLLLDVGDIVFMRKCLLGIKRRVDVLGG